MHRRIARPVGGLLGVLSLVATLAISLPGVALAHGREVRISLASWVPDPEFPLTRLYQAKVVYANDQELVEGADVALFASRTDGASGIESTALMPLQGSPGLYLGPIRFPRFGEWNVTLHADRPGQGEVTRTEQVNPSGVPPASTTERRQSPATLDLRFGFDWQDALNIVVRVGHSVGAATYLGTGAVMLLGLWFDTYLTNSRAWRAVQQAAFPLALGSLLLLLVSGLYTGYFDAPVRAPGVFNARALSLVPFGQEYAAAFASKVVLGLGVLLVLWRVRHARQSQRLYRGPTNGSLAIGLTLGFGTLVVLLLTNVVVLVYLHYISHLGASLPIR
jgi:hypothetical protein